MDVIRRAQPARPTARAHVPAPQPQDLLKSQVQAQMLARKAPVEGAPPVKVAPRFAGVGDCAKAILAERGAVGLTQGLPATIARNIVGVSAYFYGYEAVRKAFALRGGRRIQDLTLLENFFAGGIGGCVGGVRVGGEGAAVCVCARPALQRRPTFTRTFFLPHRRLAYWILCYPLDIIKSAIQTDSIYPEARRYRGSVLATGRQLFAEGGVKRFTAGLAPCLARAFPANAAGFAIYEAVTAAMR